MARLIFTHEKGSPPGSEEQLVSPLERDKNWDIYGHYGPGDIFHSEVGAPGIGFSKHRVTRNDRTGLWGVLVESQISELDPWDVM